MNGSDTQDTSWLGKAIASAHSPYGSIESMTALAAIAIAEALTRSADVAEAHLEISRRSIELHEEGAALNRRSIELHELQAQRMEGMDTRNSALEAMSENMEQIAAAIETTDLYLQSVPAMIREEVRTILFGIATAK